MEALNIKRNIKPFDGEKYSVWKFRIRSLLTELNVIKVIDEEVPDIISEEWYKADRIAKNVIVEYLADSLLNFVQTENSAKQVLKNLDAIYERKSVATQLAVRKKLLTLKLQSDTPLIKHFTVFDNLISELSTTGAKLEEIDKASYLLLTLPPCYDGIIKAIEQLSEDNLTVTFIKTRLLDHEMKLNSEYRDTSSKLLQATKMQNFEITTPRKHYKDQNKSSICRITHLVHVIKCHQCGRKGHIRRNCFHYKKTQKYLNNDQNKISEAIEIRKPSISKNTEANCSSFSFMIGDYSSQLTMDNRIVFLLSSASEHLINREDVANNFTILERPIKFSVAKNGTYIEAMKKGSMTVTTDMGCQAIIKNIYYCPDVAYNLLSVRKIQQAGMTVTFDNAGVKISKGGKTIMSGHQLADTLTKQLPAIKFQEFRTEFGLH